MNFITTHNRIYANDENGQVIAEVTFAISSSVATIDHTFVAKPLRGQGVAAQLVKMAADQILASGLLISATCSYAALWLQRHPNYPVVAPNSPIACKIGGRHS